jgi:glutamate--cysteine ligase
MGSGQGLGHGRARIAALLRPQAGSGRPIPGGGTLKDIAAEVLDIARSGLRRAQKNAIGDDETGYLAPLDDVVRSGKVPAQRLLDLYHGAWNGDLSRIYDVKSF